MLPIVAIDSLLECNYLLEMEDFTVFHLKYGHSEAALFAEARPVSVH